ncbi:MAG: AMP-binding protein [Flavobacteriaceae bacterium]|nr:AMP-binding protein [Flavobacteriaceae bacterium]
MSNIYTASSGEIKRIQWLQLEKQLLYLQKNSGFYRKLFKKNEIDPDKINSYIEFQKIPITTKENVQEFNQDFLCVPESEIIDFVTTSGTLGKPVSFALNETDLQRLATNEMESFKMIGIKKEDVVQITTTLDRRFMAGMAYFLGLRKLGAGIVRTGSGFPQLQWDSIARFKPKYLVAVPSFLLKMIEYSELNNIDCNNSSVKAVICIGEPIRDLEFKLNSLGSKISKLWDIELFSTYASTEMATAFTECEAHRGNHAQPELIFTEILDEAGNPVKPGETGELVITTLQVETMPLLRFATGDMVSYTDEPCPCGRNTLRLSPVLGRKKQMIKFKGTSLYPQHIIEVLNNFKGIPAFVIEVNTNDVGTDAVVVKIPDSLSAEKVSLLKEHFKSKLQVTPTLEQVSLKIIEKLKSPEGSRKPLVFIDYR